VVDLVEVRCEASAGTTRDAARRLATRAQKALAARPGAPALRLDLTPMLDPGHAWVDELLNRQLAPYCAERGIPITIWVGTDFAEEQLTRGLTATSRSLIRIWRVEARRGRPRGSRSRRSPAAGGCYRRRALYS